MKVTHKKNSKLISIVQKHINDNIKSYLIVACILLVGIVLGVILINNLNEEQLKEVHTYINNFITSLKNGASINTGKLLQNSIKSNVVLAIILWFAGSTVIGIPIVLGIIAFRGFCIGYTCSALIGTLGTWKGTLFFITSMLLQNIIFIPCILALSVSGIKLYKSIMKDKRKENIKGEIIRHTLFSLMILGILIVASFIETYLSSGLFTMCVQYL